MLPDWRSGDSRTDTLPDVGLVNMTSPILVNPVTDSENVTVNETGVEPDTGSPLFKGGDVAVNEVIVGAVTSNVKLCIADAVLPLPTGSWMTSAGIDIPTCVSVEPV